MRLVLAAALVCGFLGASQSNAAAGYRQSAWSEKQRQICIRKRNTVRLDFWFF